MKMQKTVIVCGACRKPNEIEVKMPGWLTPTVLKISCRVCESRFVLTFSRIKGEQNKLQVREVLLSISEAGKAAVIERENSAKNLGAAHG